MPEYTTKEAVENYLLRNIDSSFNDQITEWIIAMSLQVDKICNRQMYRAEEETYVYDGDGTDMIMIKDCCDISAVTVDGVEKTVYKYPVNKEYASRIRLDGDTFTKGLQNVAVTGIQAMSATLQEDVKYACTVMVAGICNAQIFNEKQGTTERIGNYQITYKDDAQKTDYERAVSALSKYKRIALG
jgi:hypothetical protein